MWAQKHYYYNSLAEVANDREIYRLNVSDQWCFHMILPEQLNYSVCQLSGCEMFVYRDILPQIRDDTLIMFKQILYR